MTNKELMLLNLKLNNAILDYILSGEWKKNEQGREKKTGEDGNK